jgi:hypothetical protein
MVWSTMLPDSSWCVPIYKSGVQQMVLLVVGVMIGFVLGLRFFNVFVLFPAFGLALLGTAAVGIGRGERLGSMILTIVFVGSALQIGYLVGILTRALWASGHLLNADGQHHLSMPKSLDVQEHMEVVGSDGKHVGTVDHKESADLIILTNDAPNAGGRPHLISIKWVDYVDAKVHLNKPSKKAMMEWQVAA